MLLVVEVAVNPSVEPSAAPVRAPLLDEGLHAFQRGLVHHVAGHGLGRVGVGSGNAFFELPVEQRLAQRQRDARLREYRLNPLLHSGIELLGRGSTCINTGGEKVFPEEVEAVIKACAGVRDALVVGLPDSRFGEVIAALVEQAPGAELSGEAITAHVRERLARHKAPRHVLVVGEALRTVTGKADYPAVRVRLQAWLAGQSV